MTEDLLRTKLYPPSGRHHCVMRPRLLARLNEGLTRPLTLLSAPPGFGKITLLTEWAAQGQLPVAWLVLDTDGNDPVRFWTYVIAALQARHAAIGSSSLALLQSSRASAVEAMLRALINEIDSLPESGALELSSGESKGQRTSLVLVLDDYHVFENAEIHQQLSFLLGPRLADEGTPMARLLPRMLTRSSTPEYVRRLLEALSESAEIELPVATSLIDPLSAREFEVLCLIVEGATAPKPARRRVNEISSRCFQLTYQVSI